MNRIVEQGCKEDWRSFSGLVCAWCESFRGGTRRPFDGATQNFPKPPVDDVKREGGGVPLRRRPSNWVDGFFFIFPITVLHFHLISSTFSETQLIYYHIGRKRSQRLEGINTGIIFNVFFALVGVLSPWGRRVKFLPSTCKQTS